MDIIKKRKSRSFYYFKHLRVSLSHLNENVDKLNLKLDFIF